MIRDDNFLKHTEHSKKVILTFFVDVKYFLKTILSIKTIAICKHTSYGL